MRKSDKIQPFRQPEVHHRTWAQAVKHERVRIGVLVAMFVVGAAVFSSLPVGGYTLMFASTLSLVGTVVAGRYFS